LTLDYWETGLAGSYLKTTDSLAAFSPKERAAMKKVTRLKIAPVTFLVLLVLLAYVAVHRKGITTEKAGDEAVGVVVRLEGMVVRDEYATVAFLALLALIAFVTWTTLRANGGEDKAMPAATESSASDKTPLR
jgi:hypothetical protein